MKKFSKFGVAVAVAASLASSAVAVNLDGFFVGVQGDYNFKSQLKINISEPNGLALQNNFDADNSNFGLGLKVGYDFGEWRAYGSYNHDFQTKDDYTNYTQALKKSVSSDMWDELEWSSNDFVLGADLTPKISLAGLDFKGILGAFAGISKIDVEYTIGAYGMGIFSDEKYSQIGFIYGLRFGGIYEINKNNEVEFGFKFNQAKYGEKEMNVSIMGTPTPLNIDDSARTNMGVFVGYNYKF